MKVLVILAVFFSMLIFGNTASAQTNRHPRHPKVVKVVKVKHHHNPHCLHRRR